MSESQRNLLLDHKMKIQLDMMATELGSAERQVYVGDIREIEKRLSSANQQSA